MPKLKLHLLPRILSTLRDEHPDNNSIPRDAEDVDPDSLLFKHDRIYQHKFIRINYTTYDVRRSQDTVNASTSHHNIMVLADSNSTLDEEFMYARVLGIYHANIIYVGAGSLDYQPRRMEFLWVRWYRKIESRRTGWDARKLDRVQFLPMSDDEAFGFINPSDVLRSSHLIPRFSRGRQHSDGKGLSRCARDSSDWREYYVMR